VFKALKIMLRIAKEIFLQTNLSNIVVRLKYSISFVNQITCHMEKQKAIKWVIYILTIVFISGCSKENIHHNTCQTDAILQALTDSLKSNLSKGEILITRQMQQTKDPILKEQMRLLLGRAYLFEAKDDSFNLLMNSIEKNMMNMKQSNETEDLLAQVNNMRGNYYTYINNPQKALLYYQKACLQARLGKQKEKIIDLYINIADVYNAQGMFVEGISYYRKALLLSDSLHYNSQKQSPIYYGLGQTYIKIRNFKEAKGNLDLAAKNFNQMTSPEKFFLLNTYGNYYYYQKKYDKALPYFISAYKLSEQDSTMMSQQNVALINMSDIYLSLNKPDSSDYCLKKCEPYFQSIKHPTALYYIQTLKMAMAVRKGNLPLAKSFIQSPMSMLHEVDPEIVNIRLNYLQDYYEKAGDYKNALTMMEEKTALMDSVRSEQNIMKMKEISLRYEQDTTIMKKELFIQKQQNEIKSMKTVSIISILLCLALLAVIGIIILYVRKQKAYLSMQYRMNLAEMKMESLRNRLSPHFLFNVLNRELSRYDEGNENRKHLMDIVTMLHKNLSLIDMNFISLQEELDFIKSFIELERPSLKDDFCFQIDMATTINPSKVILPSMLLEIPVENAIKHGLMGLDIQQKLNISISEDTDDVIIYVCDNGRDFSLQSIKNPINSTGTGLKVLLQTIQMLNQYNKRPLFFHIGNMRDKQEKTTGCQVEIRIPKHYKFDVERKNRQ